MKVLFKMGKRTNQPEGCSRFRLNNNNNNARAPGAVILQPPDPNKTISLGIDVKPVSNINPNPNYKPNIDLKVLLTNSLTARRPKKRAGKPPRPQNAFFLYMREKINNPRYGKLLKDRVGKIAEQWRNAPKEEKGVFIYYAEIAKEIHAAQYEDYQWFSPPNDQQNRNDEPDDIKSTPPDRPDSSPISTTSSSEPDSPPFHDDHHGNESRDFELYYDQSTAINFDLLEFFLTYSQSELSNQTIPYSMNHQPYETSSPDQLDQNETFDSVTDNLAPVSVEAYSPLPSYGLGFNQFDLGTFIMEMSPEEMSPEEIRPDNIDVFDIHQYFSYEDF